ncbi:MAG: carboxypeptidase regulatory-like domain-containing protein [Planctomycetes bacterium]|nr:carboxypeptidase regulatory-like domain-containing protein [Planctomycetota bacterium]
MRASALFICGVLLLTAAGGVWYLAISPQTTGNQAIASSGPATAPAGDRSLAGVPNAGSNSRERAATVAAVRNDEPGEPNRVAASDGETKAAKPKVEHFTTVMGQVMDFSGAPAPGAGIRLVGKKGTGFLPEPDAVTDDNGKFSAKIKFNYKKKEMRVRISRKDRLAIVVDNLELKRDESKDLGILQFDAVGSLEVAVVDSQNRPVPNAQVHLKTIKSETPDENAEADFIRIRNQGNNDPGQMMERASSMMQGERTTNEQGIATFAAVAPGHVSISVNLAGMGDFGGFGNRNKKNNNNNEKETENSSPLALDASSVAPHPIEPKEVRIIAGRKEIIEFAVSGVGVLTGRAMVHGQGLANEWLGLHLASMSGSVAANFAPHVRTQTDAAGKFTFPGVTPGEYVVKHGDPGPGMSLEKMSDPDQMFEASMEIAGSMFGGGGDHQKDLARSVTIREGNNQADVDFGGSQIDVFVTDADGGEPLPNATVRIFDRDDSPPHDSSDPILKETLGYANAKLISSFMPRSDGKRPVRLKAAADSKGRAEFTNLEGGKFRIIARVPGHPPSLPSDFQLLDGESRRVIVKVPKGVGIVGTVNDRSGNALPEATVWEVNDRELEPGFPDLILSSAVSTRTNEKGIFKFEGLDAGGHKLVASARGYAPALESANAPSEGTQFFLDKCGTIRLRVMRDGKPVKNAIVSLDKSAKDAPIPPEVWTALGMQDLMNLQNHMDATDENGYARLKNVPPGDWPVAVRMMGRGAPPTPVSAAPDSAESGQNGGNVKSPFSGTRSIKVRVSPDTEATALLDLKD